MLQRALGTRGDRLRAAIRSRLSGFVRGGTNPAPGQNASAYAVPDYALWPLRELYEGTYPVAPVSYGTGRELADSVDNIRGLAAASIDMKSLQRCWMVKAILGNVARGARLLEIGAGEPLVAGLLSRLGYEVTIVDPYDGSGNGPREYGLFTDTYRDLSFVRDQFPPAQRLEPGFGAIYSISVLEHIPVEAVDGVTDGIRALLADGGCSIHAIDHVTSGWGAEEHVERLERIAAGTGIDRAQLDAAVAAAEADPETYFVSAEVHNLWRGGIPYDDYPMRRIISLNLFARL